jgi:hypothetical protein
VAGGEVGADGVGVGGPCYVGAQYEGVTGGEANAAARAVLQAETGAVELRQGAIVGPEPARVEEAGDAEGVGLAPEVEVEEFAA